MLENLEDYLDNRSKELKEEKQRQLNAVAKMRQEAETEKQKFVTSVVKIIKPQMSKMLKIFSAKGHTLQNNREDLTSTTPLIQYALTLDEPGKPVYLIEFDSNISGAEVAFSIFKHNTPTKCYNKNLKYELSEEDIEKEVIMGLKFLKDQ